MIIILELGSRSEVSEKFENIKGHMWYHGSASEHSEGVACRCSSEEIFLKISQISHR